MTNLPSRDLGQTFRLGTPFSPLICPNICSLRVTQATSREARFGMFLPTQSWFLRVKCVFQCVRRALGPLGPSVRMVWPKVVGERGGCKRVAWNHFCSAQAGAMGCQPGAGPGSQSPALSPGPQFSCAHWGGGSAHSTLPRAQSYPLLLPYPSSPLLPSLLSSSSPPLPFLPYLSPLPSFVMGFNPGHQARLPYLAAPPV